VFGEPGAIAIKDGSPFRLAALEPTGIGLSADLWSSS